MTTVVAQRYIEGARDDLMMATTTAEAIKFGLWGLVFRFGLTTVGRWVEFVNISASI